MTIKIGIVGFGKIAQDQHGPAIAAMPDAELVAIADTAVEAEDIACYTNINAMLEGEPQLDAVAMCQPPQARFAAARAALMAGKHVLLEKPPGATLAEVEGLIALAREKGVTLFTAWHSQQASAAKAGRAWLADKTIHSVAINWKEDVRVWHPGQQWIWQPGGFGVFDPGINALSLLTAIMPETMRLTAAELFTPANRAAPIAANLTLATASSVPITAEFDFRQTGPQNWDMVVETASGTLLLQHGGNLMSIDGQAQACGTQSEYPRLYRRFLDLISRGNSDVDLAPLKLVADAFMIGRFTLVEPFED